MVSTIWQICRYVWFVFLLTTCECQTDLSTGSFVNPIGLENADWKYLIVYVCWLCFEIVFIYFFFPETFGKTLEELTFCKFNALCQYMNGKS